MHIFRFAFQLVASVGGPLDHVVGIGCWKRLVSIEATTWICKYLQYKSLPVARRKPATALSSRAFWLVIVTLSGRSAKDGQRCCLLRGRNRVKLSSGSMSGEVSVVRFGSRRGGTRGLWEVEVEALEAGAPCWNPTT